MTKASRSASPTATSLVIAGSLASSAWPSAAWRSVLGSVASTVAPWSVPSSTDISPTSAPGLVIVLTCDVALAHPQRAGDEHPDARRCVPPSLNDGFAGCEFDLGKVRRERRACPSPQHRR